MKTNILILAAALALPVFPALADKPSWAGNDKHEQHNKQQNEHAKQGKGHERAERLNADGVSLSFSVDTRRMVSDYYGHQARAGNCPPGLARKHNGCLPPGQAKKWTRGAPLPAGLQYHDLPYELLRRLPPPPPNYRYVQIAGDVLMIAIGTSMVVDAIEDILR